MTKKSIEDILSDIEGDDSKNVQKTPDNVKTPVKFKKKKKKSWKKRIILTLLVIFLVGGSFLGYKAYVLAKKMFEGGSAPGLLGLFGQGQLKGEADGRVNVLLLGIGGDNHPGANLTDTIMVASIKPATNEVALLSVPRDLYVPIDGYGKDKINAANALGEQKNYSGGGMALSKDTISKTLDIPIHYTVRVDFSGFEKIIDTVGGVDINVEKDLYDPFYPDNGTYSIKAGMHHMDGKAALKYARSRETTSDFDRAKRQQQIMVQVKEKVFSTNTLLNPAKMSEILGILGDHIKTDMQIWEGQRLAQMFQRVDKNKIINKVLDDGPDGPLESANNGAYVLLPKSGNFDEIRNIAKNIFTLGPLQNEAAKVQVLNATGASGQAKKAADNISGFGMKILDVSNSDDINSSTIIYDHTNGAKSKTIAFLEEKYCVKAVQKADSTGADYDITVVIGKDQLNKD